MASDAVTVTGTADLSNMTAPVIQVANTGGGQAHSNLQPFSAVNYIIALQGVFPSRS